MVVMVAGAAPRWISGGGGHLQEPFLEQSTVTITTIVGELFPLGASLILTLRCKVNYPI